MPPRPSGARMRYLPNITAARLAGQQPVGLVAGEFAGGHEFGGQVGGVGVGVGVAGEFVGPLVARAAGCGGSRRGTAPVVRGRPRKSSSDPRPSVQGAPLS